MSPIYLNKYLRLRLLWWKCWCTLIAINVNIIKRLEAWHEVYCELQKSSWELLFTIILLSFNRVLFIKPENRKYRVLSRSIPSTNYKYVMINLAILCPTILILTTLLFFSFENIVPPQINHWLFLLINCPINLFKMSWWRIGEGMDRKCWA